MTKEFQLIIVDDGSTDKETIRWIKDNEKPLNFVRIRNEVAKGFSKACNLGIDYAMEHYDFDCLCLLNSDTEILTDDWFNKVSVHISPEAKIGVMGVMSDNALAQTVKNRDRYLAHIDKKPTVYCYIIHGFCYFITRELIKTVGRFDSELFPHYGSEDDYSLKSIKAGFHNLLVGSVFVHHNNETSYGKETRVSFIQNTVPALHKRWGKSYCDRCGNQAVAAGKYVNNKY